MHAEGDPFFVETYMGGRQLEFDYSIGLNLYCGKRCVQCSLP